MPRAKNLEVRAKVSRSPEVITPRSRIIEKIHTWVEHDIALKDSLLDFLLPQEAFDVSKTHWTPMSVVYAVLSMLKPGDQTRLLDVGSGCGKFCTTAALLGPGSFTGIEMRPWLHQTARGLKFDLGAERARFLLGDMKDLDWTPYNCFYFFNPFHEHILDEEVSDRKRIDQTLDFKVDTYMEYRRIVREKLSACSSGTRVVTYHGLGGPMPEDFTLVESREAGTSEVKLWVKV